MKKEEKELSIQEETYKNCPLLYKMAYRPCTETCMCWGWEFGQGWNNIAQEMSYKLEALNNIFYPKFRVRIEMDQMKEKYGLLTVYHSVVVDPCKTVTFIQNALDGIWQRLEKLDFKYKRVVDVEPYDYDESEEIDKATYEHETGPKACKCSNVSYKKVNDDLYIRTTQLHNYGKAHNEPTKHRISHKLMNWLRTASNRLGITFANSDPKSIVAMRCLDDLACKIIDEATAEAAKHCEKCGQRIGTDWSPTCTTRGWITYICKDCAKEKDREYYMNGELYQYDKVIKSKDQISIENSLHTLQYSWHDNMNISVNKENWKVVIVNDLAITDFVKDENSDSKTAKVKLINEAGENAMLVFTKHNDLKLITATIYKVDSNDNVISGINALNLAITKD